MGHDNQDTPSSFSTCYNDDNKDADITSKDDDLHELNVESFYQGSNDDLVENHEMLLANEKVHLRGLVDSKKRKKRSIDEGTLAQVALTAVMEGDERCGSPSSCWFEGNSCVQRRRSTSLNDLMEIEKETVLETETATNKNIQIATYDKVESNLPSSEYKAKKALGHSRSRSDGTRLIKTTKRQQSVQEVPRRTKDEHKLSSDSLSRLSSSLPESSGMFSFNLIREEFPNTAI